jgi:hypothetical protein
MPDPVPGPPLAGGHLRPARQRTLGPPPRLRRLHPPGGRLRRGGRAAAGRRRDWRGYLEWFLSQCFTESHSTKQIEDCVGWGLETDAETTVGLCAKVRCPTVVVHGTADALVEPERGIALAGRLGCPVVLLEGSGHGPHVRDPVRFNLLLREFAGSLTPGRAGGRRSWTRARNRRKRALYLSSPIGLGHARRDVAIAREQAAGRVGAARPPRRRPGGRARGLGDDPLGVGEPLPARYGRGVTVHV